MISLKLPHSRCQRFALARLLDEVSWLSKTNSKLSNQYPIFEGIFYRILYKMITFFFWWNHISFQCFKAQNFKASQTATDIASK